MARTSKISYSPVNTDFTGNAIQSFQNNRLAERKFALDSARNARLDSP